MGIRLQRLLAPVTALEPGMYTTETTHGQVAIACPGCGEVSDLPDTHVVARDGVVTPVWVCPSERCPLIEWLVLETD